MNAKNCLPANECLKENINITPLPGPSAVTTAMSVCGFSEKYFFYGFFPEKEKIIKDNLSLLSELNYSLVFFVCFYIINDR